MALSTDVSRVSSRHKKNGEKRKEERPAAHHGGVTNPEGLAVPRRYTRPGVHPYVGIAWDKRISKITERDGRVVFEMKDVEVPASWSQLATDIIAQKYFRKAGVATDLKSETSAKQVVTRIAKTIRDFGELHRYFRAAEDAETFEMELTHILINQYAAFNSPVWFNCGLEHLYGIKGSGGNWAHDFAMGGVKPISNNYERPQCSACQPYHALVTTPSGMVPIGKIVDEDRVGAQVCDSRGTTRILATKRNGVKEVFRVSLSNGSYIQATGDHLVRAVQERRTAPVWTRVDELSVGMRLHLLPRPTTLASLAADGGSEAVDRQFFSADLPADPPVTVQDPHLISEAALAGWLQADGFVGQYDHGTNRSLTVEFETVNKEEFDWVLEHLDAVFPGVHRKITPVQTDDQNLVYRRIRLYGEKLRGFVDRYGLLQRGTAIRVPRQLFSAPRDVVRAYVRSVYQSEGFVATRGRTTRIGLATMSESWMEDIQLLLFSIGIYSRRYRKREPREDRHDQHQVDISIRSERARFAKEIGFIGEAKQKRLWASLSTPGENCPPLREEAIVRIQSEGHQEVYDIQTESGEYLSNNLVVHNCFIQNVEDSLDSMLELQKSEVLLFKFGSGTGTNFSKIRGKGEQLAGGGSSSGVISFLKGFDSWAGSIKSGGTTRRAAKMVVLDIDHPEVEDFIVWKVKEEEKARKLIAAGLDNDWRGEAYQTISGQNANNSVRIPDAFMEAYLDDKEWSTIRRTDGKVHKTYKARELMREISQAAWACADPGVQYHDVINSWHPVSNTGPIRASNPCSEFMHLDDTACNLSSINLMHYLRDDGTFDIESYRHTIRVLIVAMEILVDLSSYPTKTIAQNSHDFRPLGLGYANLGTLLMVRGIPYDSEEGRAWSAAISAVLCGHAYLTSVELARAVGAFPGYQANREPFLRVMRRHTECARKIHSSCPPLLRKAAVEDWEATVREGEKHGYRNAQATVIAPTGTIGLLMDCDTTGIEPDFSIVKWKKLAGGGVVRIANQSIPMALSNLGYKDAQVKEIITHILGDGTKENPGKETIEGAPHLKQEHYPVFDCANKCGDGQRFIKPMAHVLMMAAVQPFISGAISKTVNCPSETAVEEIEQLYVESWRLGLKAVALYRDGSKGSQPLTTKVDDKAKTVTVAAGPAGTPRGVLEQLPRNNQNVYKTAVKVNDPDLGAVSVHLIFVEQPLGSPKEIFLSVGRNGQVVHEICRDLGMAWSKMLRLGMAVEILAGDLIGEKGVVRGMTDHPLIKSCLSIKDLVGKILAYEYLNRTEFIDQDLLAEYRSDPNTPEPRCVELELYRKFKQQQRKEKKLTEFDAELKVEQKAPKTYEVYLSKMMGDAPDCNICGHKTVRNAACYKCLNCGNSMGCS